MNFPNNITIYAYIKFIINSIINHECNEKLYLKLFTDRHKKFRAIKIKNEIKKLYINSIVL
jgi:hypothetical protein